jgi:hypothetical protein
MAGCRREAGAELSEDGALVSLIDVPQPDPERRCGGAISLVLVAPPPGGDDRRGGAAWAVHANTAECTGFWSRSARLLRRALEANKEARPREDPLGFHSQLLDLVGDASEGKSV